jgi:hypothetical protein
MTKCPINVHENIKRLDECIDKCNEELKNEKEKYENAVKTINEQINKYEGCLMVFKGFAEKGFINLADETGIIETLTENERMRLKLLERLYWSDIEKPAFPFKSICSRDREALSRHMRDTIKNVNPVEPSGCTTIPENGDTIHKHDNENGDTIHKHDNENGDTIHKHDNENDDKKDPDADLSLEDLYKKYRTM